VKRIGRARFLRNVLVAIGNSGDPGLIPAALAGAGDGDPLVRAHAVWALSRLLDAPAFRAAMRDDPDPDVAGEWRLGLEEVSSRPLPASGS
jgi:epoxyqueuosine reductase